MKKEIATFKNPTGRENGNVCYAIKSICTWTIGFALYGPLVFQTAPATNYQLSRDSRLILSVGNSRTVSLFTKSTANFNRTIRICGNPTLLGENCLSLPNYKYNLTCLYLLNMQYIKLCNKRKWFLLL